MTAPPPPNTQIIVNTAVLKFTDSLEEDSGSQDHDNTSSLLKIAVSQQEDPQALNDSLSYEDMSQTQLPFETDGKSLKTPMRQTSFIGSTGRNIKESPADTSAISSAKDDPDATPVLKPSERPFTLAITSPLPSNQCSEDVSSPSVLVQSNSKTLISHCPKKRPVFGKKKMPLVAPEVATTLTLLKDNGPSSSVAQHLPTNINMKISENEEPLVCENSAEAKAKKPVFSVKPIAKQAPTDSSIKKTIETPSESIPDKVQPKKLSAEEKEVRKKELEQKKLERENKKKEIEQKRIERELKKVERENQKEQKRLEIEQRKAEREQKRIEKELKKVEQQKQKTGTQKKELNGTAKNSLEEVEKFSGEGEGLKNSDESSRNQGRSECPEGVSSESTTEVLVVNVVKPNNNQNNNCTEAEGSKDLTVSVPGGENGDLTISVPSGENSDYSKALTIISDQSLQIKFTSPVKKFNPPNQTKPDLQTPKPKMLKNSGNGKDDENSSRLPKKRQRKSAESDSDSDSYMRTKQSKPANFSGPVWVQCENVGCQKWRKLKDCTDPSEVPEEWMCSMNTDTEHSRCSAPEEDWADHEESQEFVETIFVPGCIVWAKLDSYPW